MNTSSSDTARWRSLALLSLALVLSMSPWFSASAVVVQLRAAWQFGESFAAWLTIAVQLGFVAGAVVAAAFGIADRFPVRRVIVVCALGASAANALVLQAGSPAEMLALRLATGFFLAGVYPPAMKFIATWFVKGRGLAMGVLVGAITIGSASPHLVNALGGAQWQVVIVVTSLATLTGAFIVGVLVHEGPYPFPVARFRLAQLGAVLRNRDVVLASVGYFGHMWELYAMWAWFSTFALSASASEGVQGAASMLAFVVIAAGFAGCVAAGALADRIGRARTALIALAVSGTCCVLAGFVHAAPLWLFLVVSMIWGVSVIADSAQFSALVTERGERELVGTALTLQLGTGFLLTIATIWIVPLIAASLDSWQWVFLVLVPGPLLGLWAMRALMRHPAHIAGSPSA